MKENVRTPKNEQTEKPGLIKRVFSKLDRAMKEKADTKAEQGCCCGGKDSKGNKCC